MLHNKIQSEKKRYGVERKHGDGEGKVMNESARKTNELLFSRCYIYSYTCYCYRVVPEASIGMLEYMMISMISFINADSSRDCVRESECTRDLEEVGTGIQQCIRK